MRKEALVLGRDEGFLHIDRNITERHPDAAAAGLAEFGQAPAFVVEHHAQPGQPEILELGVIGKIGGRLVEIGDHLADIDRRLVDRLVLAELPVGLEQIVEAHPVERLDIAGHRLRVVHRRRDQVVQIDGLDVEHLADVGAAGLQQSRHLGLILHRIKIGADGVGLGRHLAQCQSGRKNLNEDWVHGRYTSAAPRRLRWSAHGSGTIILQALVPSH